MSGSTDDQEWYNQHPILAVLVVIAVTGIGIFLFSHSIGQGGTSCGQWDYNCEEQRNSAEQYQEEVEQHENEQKVEDFYNTKN